MRYAITPAFSLGGSYTFTDGHVSDDGKSVAPKWNQFMLQADYVLSRRTDLYLEGVVNLCQVRMASRFSATRRAIRWRLRRAIGRRLWHWECGIGSERRKSTERR